MTPIKDGGRMLGCIGLPLSVCVQRPVGGVFDSPVWSVVRYKPDFTLATRLAKPGLKHVGYVSGIMIGIAQAIAIIPGVSRAGSTISLAMFLGIDRTQAARYSFLLSLPVILGRVCSSARFSTGGTVE